MLGVMYTNAVALWMVVGLVGCTARDDRDVTPDAAIFIESTPSTHLDAAIVDAPPHTCGTPPSLPARSPLFTTDRVSMTVAEYEATLAFEDRSIVWIECWLFLDKQ